MMRLANRTHELKLFDRILKREIDERILLIEAASGYGKTNLLKQFERHCSNCSLCALVDLKSAQRGIAYFLSAVPQRIKTKLNRSNCFPCLDTEVQSYLRSGVEVTNTTMIGKENQLSVVLSSPDENTRNFRLIRLREAFFQDLQAIDRPITLILDTFNEAPQELTDWLSGEFLIDAVNTNNLVVVIAGQQVPCPTSECVGHYKHCCLEPILDEDAWYAYAKGEGLPFDRSAIKMAMEIFKGHPSDIVKTFESLEKRWQQ